MKNINHQKNALICGCLYLALIIVGMYAFVYALPQIKIAGDISATMTNVIEAKSLFRFAIFSILLMNVISIVLVLYLYKLLSSVNKITSLVMLCFLLLGAGISMFNEINHFAILFINSSSNFSIQEAQNLTDLFISLQKHGSYIAVIFWGLWLFPLGKLIYTLETRTTKFIGIMLAIAGVGYIIDSILLFLAPKSVDFIISDYTFIGELLLTILLLFKSNSVKKLVLKRAEVQLNML